MCGVTGIIGENIGNKEKVIGQMTKAIFHRGPDDEGYFVDKYVGLGMRRLSIIDLSRGKQPITSKDEKLLIFFNGEIYNYKELKEELLSKKYEFKTDTDTEVILHMYEEYGEKMLNLLRGMFVFTIYNTETHEIFIARDFFGIKPLYYLTQNEKIIAFSSEIKSFFSIPDFKAEVNDNAVFNYLSFQYNPLPETFFKNVYKLPPGHFMIIDTEKGEVMLKKYWSYEFRQDKNLPEKRTAEQILNTMRDSVKHHMIADVPVGSFLSGGIDSSVIATLMQEIRQTDPDASNGIVKTFTVGFKSLTEANEATQTSDFLKTDHTEITVSPEEYFDSLEKVVYHFDEPVADPSAVGLYFLAKEAKKNVKVVLSGEGSDELFGGYNIYLEPFARNRLAWIPKPIIGLIVSFFDSLKFDFWGTNYLRRLNVGLQNWYIGNASIFKQVDLQALWKRVSQKTISLNPLFKRTTGLSESTQMQYIDINTWLIGDILAKADKMTMAHSLELRVPFLDIEVATLASILPDSFKWREGKTKYLFREAFKRIIPEETRNRKKLGFPTPVRDWFTRDREELYKIILKNEYINQKMNTVVIEEIINDHVSRNTDNSRKIYTLLLLSLWYNIFIKNKGVLSQK
ncbi:MAG: asparagine synthase (glutamine-hydrolyzing) [Minisyncoccia bacterium]